MQRIKLVYWHTNIDNYGDLLSPYIIQKLSGCHIVHKNYFVGNWKSHIYNWVKEISHLNLSLDCDYLFPFESNVVGVGSIIFSGNKRSHIWGSGFMSQMEQCKYGIIHAVRGYLSLEKIREQIAEGSCVKFADKVAIGDPGLLLPLFISPSDKKYRIGIVPHFSEIEYFEETYGDKYHVIDLRSADIEFVTNEITSCEYILSTSLHGIIVAHAYGVPALWCEHTGLEEDTNGFKFHDYFSSIGIESYLPIREFDEVLKDESTIVAQFNIRRASILPSIDLEQLRADLLEVAPFPIINNKFE